MQFADSTHSIAEWATHREAFVVELEPGFAPEQKPKPWLDSRQMALARKVLENELVRSGETTRRGIEGQRFGRLLVLRPLAAYGRNRAWLCRCDCGKEKAIRSQTLMQGNSRSCGCLAREHAARLAALNQPKAVAALVKKAQERKAKKAAA